MVSVGLDGESVSLEHEKAGHRDVPIWSAVCETPNQLFAGLGVTNSRDDHIVVELLDHKFKSLSRRYCDIILPSSSGGSI